MSTNITQNTTALEELLETASNLPESGGSGESGATFLPSVSSDGIISWTNNKNLPNPTPINIKGADGEPGKTAYQYAQEAGYTGTENEFANRMVQPIPDKLADLQEDATHRTVTDAEKTAWGAKSDFSGSYNDLSDKPTIPSTDGLASTEYVDNAVKDKVDKDGNKVLSTNDYTTEEKNKLATIAAGAEVNVNADWNATSGDAQILNKPTLGSMAAKNSVAKNDLVSDVQTSLDKADSALQPSDISDWAKATTKPTYTASEVGALPDSTKIPSKLGELENDKQYITAAEVPDEIYVGDGTMPNTATIQFIMDASDEEALLKDELQEYINTEIEAAKTRLELDIPSKTSQLTNDSGFITAEDIPEMQVPDLSGYAKTSDIPTKTSQLTNDSGFITQHQSLAGYAKTSDIPTKVSQLTNDSGFITAKDVPEAQVPDLSGYALKSSAETWTFTLSDGSKVTKKVVLA